MSEASHNGQMHIEDLFEDLEAQFVAAESPPRGANPIEQARLLEVQLLNGERYRLVAPILGTDFVAGLTEGFAAWQLVSLASVAKLLFRAEADSQLPLLRNLNLNLAEFLASLPKPASVRWRLRGQQDLTASGRLQTVTAKLLMLFQDSGSNPVWVPTDSLEILMIRAVDNSNEN